MSKAGERILRGAEEALAYARGQGEGFAAFPFGTPAAPAPQGEEVFVSTE